MVVGLSWRQHKTNRQNTNALAHLYIDRGSYKNVKDLKSNKECLWYHRYVVSQRVVVHGMVTGPKILLKLYRATNRFVFAVAFFCIDYLNVFQVQNVSCIGVPIS